MATSEELARIQSYQYPSGHLGHLTAAQQDRLEDFKQLCAKEGYYKPASGGQEASHDDETMLRYLRARKFEPKEAFVQFKDTEDWRKANKMDELYRTIDVEEYEASRRLYPQWTGRRDKRGIPVYLFEVAHLNSKTISQYEHSISKSTSLVANVPTKMLRLFALYENLTTFVMPLCSALPNRPHLETPISQSNNIVDISKVGLKQFWNLKGHMQDASVLATAHYPETLDRIFIIGAPSFFPTVWGWIKRWFDPITVSKIFILSGSDVKTTLETYIDPANIPRKYGGQLDFEWGMLPQFDKDIEDLLEWHTPHPGSGKHRTIPTGPISWRTNANGDMIATAVGTHNGKQREEMIATLPASRINKKASTVTPGVASKRFEPTLFRTETGNSTHPKEEGDLYYGQELEGTDESAPSNSSGTATPASALPYRSATNNSAQQQYRNEPVASDPTRIGTSTTRYAAQEPTHARGQMSEATPDVKHHGHGDKTATMEPNTIGQAAKEVPVPRAEEPAPGYMEQAKSMANSAYSSATGATSAVLGAVGLGGAANAAEEEKRKAEEAKEHKKPEDPAVDRTSDRTVEEYLRQQHVEVKEADVERGTSISSAVVAQAVPVEKIRNPRRKARADEKRRRNTENLARKERDREAMAKLERVPTVKRHGGGEAEPESKPKRKWYHTLLCARPAATGEPTRYVR